MEPDDDLEAVGLDEAASGEGVRRNADIFLQPGIFCSRTTRYFRAASSFALKSCVSILVCVALEEMLGERIEYFRVYQDQTPKLQVGDSLQSTSFS